MIPDMLERVEWSSRTRRSVSSAQRGERVHRRVRAHPGHQRRLFEFDLSRVAFDHGSADAWLRADRVEQGLIGLVGLDLEAPARLGDRGERELLGHRAAGAVRGLAQRARAPVHADQRGDEQRAEADRGESHEEAHPAARAVHGLHGSPCSQGAGQLARREISRAHRVKASRPPVAPRRRDPWSD